MINNEVSIVNISRRHDAGLALLLQVPSEVSGKYYQHHQISLLKAGHHSGQRELHCPQHQL